MLPTAKASIEEAGLKVGPSCAVAVLGSVPLSYTSPFLGVMLTTAALLSPAQVRSAGSNPAILSADCTELSSIGSLNVTLMVEVELTPVVPFDGLTLVTVGGVVSPVAPPVAEPPVMAPPLAEPPRCASFGRSAACRSSIAGGIHHRHTRAA